jgi:hypothetical protein
MKVLTVNPNTGSAAWSDMSPLLGILRQLGRFLDFQPGLRVAPLCGTWWEPIRPATFPPYCRCVISFEYLVVTAENVLVTV